MLITAAIYSTVYVYTMHLACNILSMSSPWTPHGRLMDAWYYIYVLYLLLLLFEGSQVDWTLNHMKSFHTFE
jgi:hypothetical protein